MNYQTPWCIFSNQFNLEAKWFMCIHRSFAFKFLLFLCVVFKCLSQAFGYACFKIFQVKIMMLMFCDLKFSDINAHSILFTSLKDDLISVSQTSLAHFQVEVTGSSIKAYVIIRFLTFPH